MSALYCTHEVKFRTFEPNFLSNLQWEEGYV